MVAKPVTGLVAGKAWPVGGEYGVAKAVPHSCNKFWRFEQQPEAWRGDCCQPVTSVGVGDAEGAQPGNVSHAPFSGEMVKKKLGVVKINWN